MVDFKIDHLDPLGQGVSRRTVLSKKGSKQSIITFIPKTLPGERGTARVLKHSKGVEFAEIQEFTELSPLRNDPECIHFAQCPGCDYLQTSYVSEIQFKKSSLAFLLRQLDLDAFDIQVIPAPSRFFYRNRIQLHYRHRYLGLIDSNGDRVLEVPGCRLVSPAVRAEMSRLYQDKSWAEVNPGRGHVELYEQCGGSVSVQWNQPYANGGFSQVNSEVNKQLRDWLLSLANQEQPRTLLDLFSGSGNLSEPLLSSYGLQRQMVDSYSFSSSEDRDDYLRLDLYAELALTQYLNKRRFETIDWLLLDPPRRGFMPLQEWVKQINPRKIIYVSCNPATLARDLRYLVYDQRKASHRIEKIALFDMFPGTRHYETVVVMGRLSN